MLFPENFEHKIDFLKVRKHLIDSCYSDMGKSLVDDMRFLTRYETIKLRLLETNEFKQILEKDEEFPADNYHDLRSSISKFVSH